MNESDELIIHLEQKIDGYAIERLKRLEKLVPTKELGRVSIKNVIGGMRGMVGLFTDTSELNPEEGIRIRGYSIDQLLEKLPKYGSVNDEVPNIAPAEGILYLLLTGSIPNIDELRLLSNWLRANAKLPDFCIKIMDELPPETHPMTQLIIGMNTLQCRSVFARKYRMNELNKENYWKAALVDVLEIIAIAPVIASHIFHKMLQSNKLNISCTTKTYNDISVDTMNRSIKLDNDKLNRQDNVSDYSDWGGRFAHSLGLMTKSQINFIRLYLLLHCDHEGGNVSAHTSHLVGSALADPYLSITAGLSGLAAPLHGLANQECLLWQLRALKSFQGKLPNSDDLEIFAKKTLSKGFVIPGYGHAVLRVVDPRCTAQLEFGKVVCRDDLRFKFLNLCIAVIPRVLKEHGKVANPYPNVDSASGVLLSCLGIGNPDFYTVLFGLSRIIGMGSQLVWARRYHLPIERPKSLSLESLEMVN